MTQLDFDAQELVGMDEFVVEVTLESIPTPVLTSIVLLLDDPKDLVRLSICCRYLKGVVLHAPVCLNLRPHGLSARDFDAAASLALTRMQLRSIDLLMPCVRSLDLSNSLVTDHDVIRLLASRRLHLLRLDGCQKLTSDIALTLAASSSTGNGPAHISLQRCLRLTPAAACRVLTGSVPSNIINGDSVGSPLVPRLRSLLLSHLDGPGLYDVASPRQRQAIAPLQPLGMTQQVDLPPQPRWPLVDSREAVHQQGPLADSGNARAVQGPRAESNSSRPSAGASSDESSSGHESNRHAAVTTGGNEPLLPNAMHRRRGGNATPHQGGGDNPSGLKAPSSSPAVGRSRPVELTQGSALSSLALHNCGLVNEASLRTVAASCPNLEALLLGGSGLGLGITGHHRNDPARLRNNNSNSSSIRASGSGNITSNSNMASSTNIASSGNVASSSNSSTSTSTVGIHNARRHRDDAIAAPIADHTNENPFTNDVSATTAPSLPGAPAVRWRRATSIAGMERTPTTVTAGRGDALLVAARDALLDAVARLPRLQLLELTFFGQDLCEQVRGGLLRSVGGRREDDGAAGEGRRRAEEDGYYYKYRSHEYGNQSTIDWHGRRVRVWDMSDLAGSDVLEDVTLQDLREAGGWAPVDCAGLSDAMHCELAERSQVFCGCKSGVMGDRDGGGEKSYDGVGGCQSSCCQHGGGFIRERDGSRNGVDAAYARSGRIDATCEELHLGPFCGGVSSASHDPSSCGLDTLAGRERPGEWGQEDIPVLHHGGGQGGSCAAKWLPLRVAGAHKAPAVGCSDCGLPEHHGCLTEKRSVSDDSGHAVHRLRSHEHEPRRLAATFKHGPFSPDGPSTGPECCAVTDASTAPSHDVGLPLHHESSQTVQVGLTHGSGRSAFGAPKREVVGDFEHGDGCPLRCCGVLRSEHQRLLLDQLPMLLRASATCSDRVRRAPLHWAAADGDVLAVAVLLLAAGPTACNPKDVRGATPLFLAAEAGHTSAVRLLLSAGADPLVCNSAGECPLYIASLKGHAGFVRLMLARCAATGRDWCDPRLYGDEWTPLHACVLADRREVMEALLLSAAASVALPQREASRTPLPREASGAVQLQEASVALRLREAPDGSPPSRASFASPSRNEGRPYQEGAVGPSRMEEAFKQGMPAPGASLLVSPSKVTPLMVTPSMASKATVAAGTPPRADPPMSGGRGSSLAVTLVAGDGGGGGDIMGGGGSGDVAHVTGNGSASGRHPAERVVALVNARNRYGQSALHLAARRGSPYFLTMLLNAGACAQIKDSYGRLPLDEAKAYGQTQTMEILEGLSQKAPQPKKRRAKGKGPILPTG